MSFSLERLLTREPLLDSGYFRKGDKKETETHSTHPASGKRKWWREVSEVGKTLSQCWHWKERWQWYLVKTLWHQPWKAPLILETQTSEHWEHKSHLTQFFFSLQKNSHIHRTQILQDVTLLTYMFQVLFLDFLKNSLSWFFLSSFFLNFRIKITHKR